MPAINSSAAWNSPTARARRRFLRNYASWLGMGLGGTFLVIALFAGVLAPYKLSERFDALDPERNLVVPLQSAPMSSEHLFGTDEHSKDLLTRVMHGSRLSLLSGVVSILLAIVLGVPIGAAAGYFGGWVDALLMRSIDVALAFPSVLIALLVAVVLPPCF